MLHALAAKSLIAAEVAVAISMLAGAGFGGALGAGEVVFPTSITFWIGTVIGGALVAAVTLAAKKWFEDQITKFLETPTKKEIFDRIDAGVKEAAKGLAEVLKVVGSVDEKVGMLSRHVEDELDELRSAGQKNTDEINKINARHNEIDRNELRRNRRKTDSDEIRRT